MHRKRETKERNVRKKKNKEAIKPPGLLLIVGLIPLSFPLANHRSLYASPDEKLKETILILCNQSLILNTALDPGLSATTNSFTPLLF